MQYVKPSNPLNACGRWQYETGGTAVAPPPLVLFEATATLIEAPAWIEIIEATIDTAAAAPIYVLVSDATNVQQAIARAAARYTYGPILPGGTMVRAYEEWWRGYDGREDFRGCPFTNGAIVLASLTPRVFTAAGAVMSIAARGQR
jgi:hypothetical protein